MHFLIVLINNLQFKTLLQVNDISEDTACI
jgi:hypothetical protein